MSYLIKVQHGEELEVEKVACVEVMVVDAVEHGMLVLSGVLSDGIRYGQLTGADDHRFPNLALHEPAYCWSRPLLLSFS